VENRDEKDLVSTDMVGVGEGKGTMRPTATYSSRNTAAAEKPTSRPNGPEPNNAQLASPF